jgi:thiamine pyrophosphate-dependent acetolactate synthase large subunit-like protein
MELFEALARALKDDDVSTLFGVVGDGNLFLADSFAKLDSTNYVAAANEAGAVLMANGYSSVSQKIGVATVTHGPGLANALPPLIDSVRGGMPVLLIAGDTAIEDEKNLQKISQRELTLPTGAGFEQVRAPRTAVHDLRTALRRTTVERRPVVLNVPAKFMWEVVEYDRAESIPVDQAVEPDPEALDLAVGMIAHARRPIVLAGRGAATPAAREALLRLAERIGAPVATTLRGTSLFRGDAFNLGVFGTLATPVALEAIVQSDCVIAFGASLNHWTTDSTALLRDKRVIQCDLERSAIGKYVPVHAALIGDAAKVANAIVSWLDEADVKASGSRSDTLAQSLKDYTHTGSTTQHGASGTVDFHTALVRIDEIVPSDRVLVADAGRFMYEAYKVLTAPDPHSFVHTCNFGAIGLGMGNAIGAAVAAPGRPVLLVCGDGGFMLGGLAEFTSAVQNNIDLIVMVLNDGTYGAEHIQFRRRDMDPGLSTFNWPELAPLAQALGGAGVTVRSVADFDAVADAVQHRDRPLLIDIKLDPDQVPYAG